LNYCFRYNGVGILKAVKIREKRVKLIRKITFVALVLSVSCLQAVAIDLTKIIGDKKSIALSELPGVKLIAATPVGSFLKGVKIDKLKLDVSGKEQKASGQVTVFGETLAAAIDRKKDAQGNFVIALDLSLPKGFKFSRINSKLKPMDIIEIEKGAIILSTGAYDDVQQGINLEFTLASDQKAIPGYKKVINVLNKAGLKIDPNLTVIGQLAPQIFNSYFSIGIGGDIKVGKFKDKYIIEKD